MRIFRAPDNVKGVEVQQLVVVVYVYFLKLVHYKIEVVFNVMHKQGVAPLYYGFFIYSFYIIRLYQKS